MNNQYIGFQSRLLAMAHNDTTRTLLYKYMYLQSAFLVVLHNTVGRETYSTIINFSSRISSMPRVSCIGYELSTSKYTLNTHKEFPQNVHSLSVPAYISTFSAF